MSELATLNKSLSFLAAFAVVGALLAMAFLLVENQGKLQEGALKVRKRATAFAGAWLVANVLHIFLTLANILGTSFADALERNTLRSFLTQVDLGQYLGVQTAMIAVIALAIRFVRTVLAATILLLFSLITLTIPVFQSHSASSGSHQLAIGSLVVHVVALSLWVGGIFAIVALPDSDRKFALPRFSQMALWTAIAVVISGITNAWARLNFMDAWSSGYARIVLLKAALTFVLLFLGYCNRRGLAQGSSSGIKLLGRFVVVEAFIMTTFSSSEVGWHSPNHRHEAISVFLQRSPLLVLQLQRNQLWRDYCCSISQMRSSWEFSSY
jgi:putative copper export protein